MDGGDHLNGHRAVCHDRRRGLGGGGVGGVGGYGDRDVGVSEGQRGGRGGCRCGCSVHTREDDLRTDSKQFRFSLLYIFVLIHCGWQSFQFHFDLSNDGLLLLEARFECLVFLYNQGGGLMVERRH